LEFAEFIHGNDLAVYCFALYLGDCDRLLNVMGKLLPEGMRGDTGVDGVEDSYDSPAHRRKKKKTQASDKVALSVVYSIYISPCSGR
jgi:hypothetical protein